MNGAMVPWHPDKATYDALAAEKEELEERLAALEADWNELMAERSYLLMEVDKLHGKRGRDKRLSTLRPTA